MTVISLHRPQRLSGVSVAGLRLAERMPELVPVVIGPGVTEDDVAKTPLASCERTRLCAWPEGASPSEQVERLRAVILEMDATAVLTNDLPHGALAASLLPGVRCVGWFHGDHPRDHGYYELVSPLCDAWAAVNETIADRVRSMTPTPGEVIPSAVSVPAQPSPMPRSDTLELLWAGWMDANKRPLDLPPLLDELDRRGLDARLSVVGTGPLEHELRRRIRSHEQAGRARWLGPVEPEVMRDVQRGSHVILMTSQTEGCPLVALEALSIGRPVIVTQRCGGVAEAITHGHDGWVVPVASIEAMAVSIEHAIGADLATIGVNAHALARSGFSDETHAPRLGSLLAATAERATASASAIGRWPAFARTMEHIGASGLAESARLFAEATGVDPQSLAPRVDRPLPPRERLVLDAVARLVEAGHRRIGLYGAGTHTRAIARCMATRAAQPIDCIIDDEPRCLELHARPVLTPQRAIARGIDAVLISSDGFEPLLREHANSWPGDLPVVSLYTEPLNASVERGGVHDDGSSFYAASDRPSAA